MQNTFSLANITTTKQTAFWNDGNVDTTAILTAINIRNFSSETIEVYVDIGNTRKFTSNIEANSTKDIFAEANIAVGLFIAENANIEIYGSANDALSAEVVIDESVRVVDSNTTATVVTYPAWYTAADIYLAKTANL